MVNNVQNNAAHEPNNDAKRGQEEAKKWFISQLLLPKYKSDLQNQRLKNPYNC